MLRNDKPLPHVFPILFICTVGCGCFVAVARGVETVCMGLIRSTDVDAVGVDCMAADGVFGCWAGCCVDVEEAEIFENEIVGMLEVRIFFCKFAMRINPDHK